MPVQPFTLGVRLFLHALQIQKLAKTESRKTNHIALTLDTTCQNEQRNALARDRRSSAPKNAAIS
jgi:cell division protein FtsI/penicillin-binding protein 2